jgi:MFS family permease
MNPPSAHSGSPKSVDGRWLQLLIGVVCMILISSPQYVWALFTQPFAAATGASLPELQITFSILIVVQTFLSPWQGVLVDRFGPRVLLSAGIAIAGLSWILAAHATTLPMLYVTWPQGSVVLGRSAASFNAAGLKRDGAMVLLTNPAAALSVTCLPELHAGDANAVKSPASIAAVGT